MDPVRQIEERLDGLTDSERKVARTILERPEDACQFSITRLAREAASSTSAVQRLCRSLGYDGYKDFRYELVASLQHDARTAGPDDPLTDAVRRMAGAVSLLEQVDRACLAALARAIVRAPLVLVTGIHRSSLPAQKLRMDLEDVGVPATSAHDVAGALHLTPLAVPDACVVHFSVAGSRVPLGTRDATDSLPTETWLVTTNPRATLPSGRQRVIALPSPNRRGEVHVDEHVVMMAFVELLMVLVGEHLAGTR